MFDSAYYFKLGISAVSVGCDVTQNVEEALYQWIQYFQHIAAEKHM